MTEKKFYKESQKDVIIAAKVGLRKMNFHVVNHHYLLVKLTRCRKSIDVFISFV